MIGEVIYWQQEPANSSGDVGPAERSFTLQELACYHGENGNGT